ncbi:MAG: hypothetical protein JWQ73_1336 [Variovorax sp.]|jgi:hypothetical protein|nr:hypothetical protein [Variovorax sp.]
MIDSVFAELSFWAMVALSVILPVAIYGVLFAKPSISRYTVLALGLTLVAIAGFDVYFLQHMQTVARTTPSLVDDAVFDSEVSFALYLFPLMFGGIGVNLISHLLISHLVGAERRFAKEHPDDR